MLWSFVFKRTISADCRPLCVAVVARFQMPTKAVVVSAIFGRPISGVLPKKPMDEWARSDETAQMERWYNTFRQRLAHFVGKTLSCSRSDTYHHMVTKWFTAEYHLVILSLTP